MADWTPKKFVSPKKRTPIKTPGQAGADAFSEALSKTSVLLNPQRPGIQEPGMLERGVSKETYEKLGGDPDKGDEQYSWTAPAPQLTGETPGSPGQWLTEAVESGKHVLSAIGEILKPLDSSPASWVTMDNPGIGFLKKLNALNTVVSTPFTIVDQALRINPEGAVVSNLVRGMFEGLAWGKRSEFKAAFKLADELGLSKWLSDNDILTEQKQQEFKSVLDEFILGVTPLVLGGAMASLKPPKLPSKKAPPTPPSGPPRDPSLVEIPDIKEIQNPSTILAPGETPKLLTEGKSPDSKGTPSIEVMRTNLLALRLAQDRMTLQRQALDPATLPGDRSRALVQLEKTIEAETNLNLYDQVGIPKEFKEAGKNDSKPAPNTPEIQTDLGVESTVKEKTSNVSPKKSKPPKKDSKPKTEDAFELQDKVAEPLIRGDAGWKESNHHVRYQIERLGDVYRELVKYGNKFIDPGYVAEKVYGVLDYIKKLKEDKLHPDDIADNVLKGVPELKAKLEDAWKQMPIKSDAQKRAIEAIEGFLSGDYKKSEAALKEFESILMSENPKDGLLKLNETLTPEEPTAPKPKSEVKTSSKNNKENSLKVPDDAKLFIEKKVRELFDEGGKEAVDNFYSEKTEFGKYAREEAKKYEAYKDAQAKLKEKTQGRLNSNPLDVLPELYEIGKYHIQRGAKKFSTWSKEMIKEAGEGVRKVLRRVWAEMKPYLTGEKALVEPGTMGVFGGQLGKSFKAKEKAGQLIDNPTEPGKLYEISDRDLKLRGKVDKLLTEGKRNDDSFKIKDRLKNLVEWDTLFKEYPKLKNSVVEIKAFGKADQDAKPSMSKGSYDGTTKEVTIYSGTKSGFESPDFLDTLVHEIQHRVSHEEGLHYGASTDTIFDAMSRDLDNVVDLQRSLRTLSRENFEKKRNREEPSFEARSQQADLNALLKDAQNEFKRKYKIPAGAFQHPFLARDLGRMHTHALRLYRSTPGELLAELSAERRTYSEPRRLLNPPKISDLQERHKGLKHEGARSDFVTELTRGDDSAKEMKSLADAVKGDKPKPPDKPKRKISAMREFPKKESGFNTFQRLTFETVNQWEPAARIARKIGLRDKSGDPTMPLSILSNRNYISSAWIKGEEGAIMKPGGWDFGRSKATIRNYLKLVKGKEQEFSDFLVARRVVKDYENQRTFKTNLHDAQKEFNDAKTWYEVTDSKDPLYKSRKKAYDEATKKLEQVKEDYDHVNEVIKNDNFDEADALNVVGRYGKQFVKAEQMYDYINKTMIDWAINSGRLSKELGEKWKAEGSYARFRKYIEEVESTTMPKSLQKSTNQSTFRERKGSEDPVIDPVYTQAQTIHETISKGLENVFWNTMKNLADTNPELRKGFYEDPHGNLKFRIEGKEVTYYIDPEYQALAETLAPKDIAKLTEFALDAGRMFVRGTTSANPIWGMLVNLPMDQLTAWTNSKFGYVPIYDAFKSFAAMRRGDANWQKFKMLGGEKSTLKGLMKEDPKIFADEILKEAHAPTDWSSIGELATKEYWKDRKLHKAKELTLNLLEMPTNLTEMATRYAEFVKAKKKGLTDTEAMYHAMNVSLPFHMSGNALGANILTKTVAYLSANINGFYRFVKSTRDQPAKVGMVAASTMLAAVGATTLFRSATDEQRRLLGQKRVEDLTKAIYLPHPNNKGLLKLRIPEVIGAFTAIPTLWAIGNILGGTKAETADYLKALGQILPTPMQFWKGKELPMSLLPQVVKPSLEVAYNTKSYPEAMPIVPEYLKDKKPRYQYTEYTSGIARFLGEISGKVADATGMSWTEVSPMLTDHWIKAQFGTMAGYILKPSNLSDNLPVYQEEGAWALSGRAMNGFYEIKKESEQLYDEAKMKKSPLKDNLPIVKRVVLTDRVADIYSDLRAVARERGIDKLPEELKEEAYDLTVAINNDPNLEAQLDRIETLSNKAKNLVEQHNVPSATTRFYKDEFSLYLQTRLETLNPEAEEEINEMTEDAKEIRKTRKKEENKNKPPREKKKKKETAKERYGF